MATPDKIYISPDIESRIWLIEKTDNHSAEYVSKDSLLEWATEKMEHYANLQSDKNDPVHWGQRNAFKQLIDKLHSI